MIGKKSMVSMHPGMIFLFGLLVGAALIYYLVSRGILPTNLLPF